MTDAAARQLAVFLGGVLALLLLLGKSLFIVYPWQSALVLQFGEIVSVKKNPGCILKRRGKACGCLIRAF